MDRLSAYHDLIAGKRVAFQGRGRCRAGRSDCGGGWMTKPKNMTPEKTAEWKERIRIRNAKPQYKERNDRIKSTPEYKEYNKNYLRKYEPTPEQIATKNERQRQIRLEQKVNRQYEHFLSALEQEGAEC